MENLIIPRCAGTGAPCDGELCDECDYLICCTRDVEPCGELCGKCREENGGCLLDINR